MLKGTRRQWFIVIIILIIFTFIWSGLIKEENAELDLNFIPEIKLSALPEEIYKSLTLMEKRAVNKYKGSDNRGFSLDIFSLSQDKKITSSIPLILQTYYNGSEQLIQKITTMPKSFVGLSTKQLASIANEWQIKEFKLDKALVLYREIDGLTPEDKKIMHLGIKDDKVAIFYGKSGNRYLKQQTDINVKDLPYSEQKALETGIIVYSQEELLTILEGLISINQD